MIGEERGVGLDHEILELNQEFLVSLGNNSALHLKDEVREGNKRDRQKVGSSRTSFVIRRREVTRAG